MVICFCAWVDSFLWLLPVGSNHFVIMSDITPQEALIFFLFSVLIIFWLDIIHYQWYCVGLSLMSHILEMSVLPNIIHQSNGSLIFIMLWIIMVFKCMLLSSAMVTFGIKHCKRLGMKVEIADIWKKDTCLANFKLKTLCSFKFPW